MFEGRSPLAIAVAVVAAAIGISTAAQRNDAGEITAAGSVDAFAIQVGDCFDDEAFSSSEISEVPGVPCTEPHDNEVYAAFDIAGEWPGEERMEQLADEGCYEQFSDVVGKSYEESVLAYTTIYPSRGSWKQRDDREVLCVGYHMEFEKLTGSIIASGL
jgi:hypothetical protein